GGPYQELGRTPTDLVDNRGNRAFIMANGVDDGGVPDVVDDYFEVDDTAGGSVGGEFNPGIDDLRETRPSAPYGDDAPARSRFMVQLIDGMNDIISAQGATIHQLIQSFITVDSTTPRLRQESEKDIPGNRPKLNPNLTITQTQTLNRQPINTLLPLAALDNDGDWGSDTRILNSADIIRDDSNENHIPDGNWDTIAETTSGFDPITGNDNRDFTDNDYDGRVDDNGDANEDGQLFYDPERHVDEDRPTYAGIIYNEEEEDSDDRIIMRRLINGEGFEKTDFGNFQNPQVLPLWEDRVDNNSNSVRWLSDGIDNDGDGLTDETLYDEILNDVNPLQARDEGVDEPGEWYLFSWDDDVTEANYDNIDNDNDGLTDLRQGDDNEDVGWTLERHGERLVFRCDEDPMDLQFVANLADSMDYSTDLDIADGATKFEVKNASREYTTEAFGMEAMRITEVLARPLIRLQAEDQDGSAPGGNWQTAADANLNDRTVDFHYVNTVGGDTGTWTFDQEIPKGKYYVLIYSFNNGLKGKVYHLEGVTANIDSAAGTFLVDQNSYDHFDTETFSEEIFPTTSTVRNGMVSGSRPHVLFTDEPVDIEGSLTVNLNCPSADSNAPFSFDYIELYAPDAQFMEMVNFGETPVDLAGWEIRQGSETFKIDDEDPQIVAPGQFVVIYPEDDAKDENEGPSGIGDLRPKGYPDDPGPEPLILTREDLFVPEDEDVEDITPFHLTTSLEDILFASSTARVVELWAPKLDPTELQDANADLNAASKTLVDSFYFNGSSDDCSVRQTYHRQDKMVFFSQRRGDPTLSMLRHDKSLLNATETIERYVHGPIRYLAEDAVVTKDPSGTIAANEPGNAASFKPEFILGRSTVPGATGEEDQITEFGETIFGLTEHEQEEFESGDHLSDDNTITFHWPGILNQFREPFTLDNTDNVPGSVDGLPVLYVRGYGVPNAPIGMFDMDTSGDNEDERLRWSGDLLFVFDPSEDLDKYEDVINIENDSIRITLRVPETADIPLAATTYGALNIPSATFAFSYIEVSAGFPETVGYMACDPGRDSYFYPDRDLTTDINARFLYMQRRRINDPNLSPEAVSERSLRFRQGPLANSSPYLPGAFGRNIEKYSMGRGVFCGPTAGEISQIMTRMEFQSDPVIDGLVNINVADQKVLLALPFFPPELRPEVFTNVRNRLRVSGLMSQVLVMGRSQRGFDGEIGEIGRDDDGDGLADLQDLGYTTSGGRPLTDRYAPSWDPPTFGPNGFGMFGFDDNGDGIIDEPAEYRAPGTDDGPYASVGQVSTPMLNPLTLKELRRLDQQMGNILRPDGSVSLLDDSDIHMMLGRIMNLITVQANEFIVISRGRVIDTQVTEQDPELNNVLAEQHLEEDLSR
ncbi:MAG: lamin tail domain-containing protein, partial [Candidatus Omnitrophica bacterium]|nr:lamin tail domain-containing protein [Candidatus Omnitrophota bacterium]